jgi:ring-1,2-phenylacetyl-CoA epoxidase subunit PaaC
VAYHLRRSSDLIVRLGDGTQRSHALVQSAVDSLWRFTGEMFDADAIEEAVSGFDARALRAEWLAYVGEVLEADTLRMPSAEAWMQKGGKQGVHSEHLSRLLAEMQILQRTHPGARW